MRNTQQASNHLDSIDVLKFVLALMVVLIHVNPFPECVNVFVMPVLRLAVPLFFVISAFFFFRKIDIGEGYSSAEVGNAIKRAISFTKRNLMLYLFWFLVLLVPTLSLRKWFDHGILYGLLDASKSFLFGSTFIASWFIMALVISVWIVLLLSLVLGNRTLVMVTIPFFVLSCLMSNYGLSPLVLPHIDILSSFFGSSPFNSFWVGLFWVAIGKCIADNELCSDAISSRKLMCAVLLGALLLAFEQTYIQLQGYSLYNDCFFMLPFVVVPLFALVLRVDLTTRWASFCRAASTVTYCLHATLRGVLATLLGALGFHASNVVLLLPVIAICCLATLAILRGEKKSGLSWLRFAH